jgi:hypothetical protein
MLTSRLTNGSPAASWDVMGPRAAEKALGIRVQSHIAPPDGAGFFS